MTNTLPEISTLHDLAKTIRETHANSLKLAESTRKKGREAIAEARLCGQALIDAKELVGHGKFLAWIGEHCGGMSRRTATRYMAVAQMGQVSQMDDAKTLNQLYIATGITKEDTCKTSSSTSESASQEKPKSESSSNSSSESTSSLPDSAAEQTRSNAEPSNATASNQPTFPIAEEDEPFEVDPFSKLRALVRSVIDECMRLGSGATGGTVEELQPIITWAQERGMI